MIQVILFVVLICFPCVLFAADDICKKPEFWSLPGAELKGCDFSGVNFNSLAEKKGKATFWFIDADLTGAIFSGNKTLSSVGFNQVNANNTKF